MIEIQTAADKARITNAIRAYLDAKNAEKAAKAEAEKRKGELLEILDGDDRMEWASDNGRKYRVVATYNKTSQSLNADLIKKVLGVDVTADCYATSRSWNEIRVTIVA